LLLRVNKIASSPVVLSTGTDVGRAVSHGLSRTISFVRQHATATTCWLTAVVFVCFLFADVIFLRTSLAPIDYTDILKRPGGSAPPASLLPERPGRRVIDSQGDIGSAAFQFEPSILFLAHCLRSGESPFWDPYSAAGTVGPETVADIKFSPFSFLTAALGGSSRVFTFVLLLLYACSCYSVLRICITFFDLSFAGAAASCIVYFLNGFTLSNLYTAIAQPYFWAPILLLACLAVTLNPNRWSITIAILAHACFFANTFFPVAVLCAIVVYGVTIAANWESAFANWYQKLALIGVIAFFGIGLLGFLYGPLIAAHLGYLHNLNEYNARQTPGYSLINLISLFTPKHIWETERAMHIPSGALPGHYEMEIQYIGIAASLIAANAFFVRRRWRLVVIVLFVCVFVSFGQIFGVPPFTLIDKLPFFSFIRNTYWSAMLVLALSFLAGFGLDALSARNSLSLPSIFVAAVIACSFFFVYGHAGISNAHWEHVYIFVFWFLLATTCLLLYSARRPKFLRWAKPLLVLLMLGEGVFYMNGLRPHRESRDVHPPASIAWVKSRIPNPSGDRVLNVGLSGIFPNWGSALGVPELGDTNLGVPAWYENFYHNYIGTGLFLSLPNSDSTYVLNDTALSLAGVRYVVVDRGFLNVIASLSALGYRVVNGDSVRVIFENPHPMPRAFVVRQLTYGDQLPRGVDSIHDMASTTDVSLLQQVQKLGISTAPQPDEKSEIKITAYHHDLVRIDCDLPSPGVLIITDSWTPWWRSYLDGHPIHLARADVTFRAVALPAGRHVIQFRYAPVALRIGEYITVVTIILLCLALWQWKRFGFSKLATPAKR